MTPHNQAQQQRANTSAVDVVVSWGRTTIAVERLALDEKFTIGPAAAADKHFVWVHGSIPTDRFPLVENSAAGIKVRSVDGMKLYVDGKKLDVADATLSHSVRAVVRVGPLEVSIAEDRKSATVLDRLRDIVDAPLLRLSGIALIMHAGAVIMMLLANAPTDRDDLTKFPSRWIATTVKAPPPAPKAKPDKKATDEPQQAAASASTPESSRHRAPVAKRSARDLASEALAALHLGGPATSTVFAAGFDTGLNTIKGAPTASAGGDGMGTRDTGGGGCGGGIGIGSITGENGPSCDDCTNLLGNAHHRMKPILKIPEPPVFSDGLSREEIQRVIGRVMSQIKFCYEKELNRDPSLEGKVAVSWVIAGDGSVATSSAKDTFGAPGGKQVSSCVNHIIERAKFPSPRGGGQVVVTYPFVFSSSGI